MDLQTFYEINQEHLEEMWAQYLSENEFGSGEDYVNPDTDVHFWEFVETMQDYYYKADHKGRKNQ